MHDMTDKDPLAAPELFAEPFGKDLNLADAAPRYQRRLTDKILAAFTHSYALDEIELANALFAALRLAEEAAQSKVGSAPPDTDDSSSAGAHPAGSGDKRAARANPGQTVQMAEYWVRLIDARQRYQQALASKSTDDDPAARKAQQEMADAYADWKSQFGPF